MSHEDTLDVPAKILTGHKGELFVCRFNSDGRILASGGLDEKVFLWDTNEFNNIGVLEQSRSTGKKKDNRYTEAVLDLQWDENSIITVHANGRGVMWDTDSNQRVRQFKDNGHKDVINTCSVGKNGGGFLLVTGSNDRMALVWDSRCKNPCAKLKHDYPVTAVSIDHNSRVISTGGIDHSIRLWDIRKGGDISDSICDPIAILCGHQDIITGLEIHPVRNDLLLSSSMDNHVIVWDINDKDLPEESVTWDRCMKTYLGATHGKEMNLIRPSWSSDGEKIACGSADGTCYIWNSATRHITNRLHGHKGCVNHVVFHPSNDVVASASSDRCVIVGGIR
jgi:Prp8 binding protein